jgi:hypothetical protein
MYKGLQFQAEQTDLDMINIFEGMFEWRVAVDRGI